MRFLQCGARTAALALCIDVSLFPQTGGIAERQKEVSVSIPFVGCKSDGQTGPMPAPNGASRSMPVNRVAAQKLAYYKSDLGVGVLAPKG